MQCLEVSGAVRPIYGSLGVKRLKTIYVHLSVYYLNILHPSPAPHFKTFQVFLICLCTSKNMGEGAVIHNYV